MYKDFLDKKQNRSIYNFSDRKGTYKSDEYRKGTYKSGEEKNEIINKGEYIFCKLFTEIDKRKMESYNLFSEYKLLLPIYKKYQVFINENVTGNPPRSYMCKYGVMYDIRDNIKSYFTLQKIQDIENFDILSDDELEIITEMLMLDSFGLYQASKEY